MFFGFFSSAGLSGILRRIKMRPSILLQAIKGFFCAVGYVKMDVFQKFRYFAANTYTVITCLIFTEINQLEV